MTYLEIGLWADIIRVTSFDYEAERLKADQGDIDIRL